MCLGTPGRFVEWVDREQHLARVDVAGVRRVVDMRLVEDDDLDADTWVLVHVGFALARIDDAPPEDG